MANPCPPSQPHTVVPVVSGSGLRFPSGQIGLLRQMAQESRTGFRVPPLRNRSSVSDGILGHFSGPNGPGKTKAAEIVARELGLSLSRVNLNQVDLDPQVGVFLEISFELFSSLLKVEGSMNGQTLWSMVNEP